MRTTIKLPRDLVLRCGSGKLASLWFSTHSPRQPSQIPGSQLISSSRTVLQPCPQKHSLILTPMLGTPLIVPLSPWLDKMIFSQTSERMGPCLLLASTSWKLPVIKTSSPSGWEFEVNCCSNWISGYSSILPHSSSLSSTHHWHIMLLLIIFWLLLTPVVRIEIPLWLLARLPVSPHS